MQYPNFPCSVMCPFSESLNEICHHKHWTRKYCERYLRLLLLLHWTRVKALFHQWYIRVTIISVVDMLISVKYIIWLKFDNKCDCVVSFYGATMSSVTAELSPLIDLRLMLFLKKIEFSFRPIIGKLFI